MVKNLLANAGDVGDVGSFPGSDAWVGKIPWTQTEALDPLNKLSLFLSPLSPP